MELCAFHFAGFVLIISLWRVRQRKRRRARKGSSRSLSNLQDFFSHPSLHGVQKTLVVQKLKVKQCNATTQTHLVTFAKFFLRIHKESFQCHSHNCKGLKVNFFLQVVEFQFTKLMFCVPRALQSSRKQQFAWFMEKCILINNMITHAGFGRKQSFRYLEGGRFSIFV